LDQPDSCARLTGASRRFGRSNSLTNPHFRRIIFKKHGKRNSRRRTLFSSAWVLWVATPRGQHRRLSPRRLDKSLTQRKPTSQLAAWATGSSLRAAQRLAPSGRDPKLSHSDQRTAPDAVQGRAEDGKQKLHLMAIAIAFRKISGTQISTSGVFRNRRRLRPDDLPVLVLSTRARGLGRSSFQPPLQALCHEGNSRAKSRVAGVSSTRPLMNFTAHRFTNFAPYLSANVVFHTGDAPTPPRHTHTIILMRCASTRPSRRLKRRCRAGECPGYLLRPPRGSETGRVNRPTSALRDLSFDSTVREFEPVGLQIPGRLVIRFLGKSGVTPQYKVAASEAVPTIGTLEGGERLTREMSDRRMLTMLQDGMLPTILEGFATRIPA